MLRVVFKRFLPSCTAVLLLGCSLDSLVKVDEPEQGREVQIGEVTTRAGALAVYADAVGQFQKGINGISENVSLFTDERIFQGQSATVHGALDARVETRNTGTGLVGLVVNQPYLDLNSARITFLQVRDVIRKLSDSSLYHLIAASYALEGYSVLMLAENYCSGIPLSTLTFDGTVRYEAGSSTAEAMKVAVSLFDSSQRVIHDSARFDILAKIGKGRAYLSLGMLDSAFENVQDVNIQEVFSLPYSESQVVNRIGIVSKPYAFWTLALDSGAVRQEIKNFEGANGIQWYPFAGTPDPRVPVINQLINGIETPRQRKYISGAIVFPLARGIERKMIEAEYWLSKGDSRWLNAINEARQTTSGIQDTVDPGTPRGRVDMLFRERAFWFYLEGHRLADYRRLVRQYNRSPYEIYPAGIYEGGDGTYQIYGDAWVFSPPEAPNREYLGCNHKQP